MFWKHNANSSPQIEALLAKEDVTLQEVMDSEDIINECRVKTKVLIDFLQKTEVMDELLTLITKEPSIDIEERTRFKYPNIACELLTCDVPALNERLAGDEVFLDKLYTFLDCDPPLNPLLASYFSKVMVALIARRKTEQNWLSYQFTCLQVLDFLKAKDTFISLLLKHLGTSAVMDLTLKLMTEVEGAEMRQNILNWLDSQRIIQLLVSLLSPGIDKDRHQNVAQLLCDFIRIARDDQTNSTERADPDPLLNTLESPEIVSLLLDCMLQGDDKSESGIVGGIQVLLALLDVSSSSSSQHLNDDLRDNDAIIYNTIQVIKDRLKDFHQLLIEPPKSNPVVTTVGTLNPPLGNARLQITKLIAALISSNNEDLLNKIVSTGTFSVLLDLFFKYHWNNFLHTQVENCLISALKTHTFEEDDGKSNVLSKHLLVDCKLIEKVLGAWKENDEQQSQENGVRKGYMGHLISLVNKIVELCSTTALGQYIKDHLPDVAKYLDEFKETTLSETNKIQETLLGGVHPSTSTDTEQYGDVMFSQSNALQQQQQLFSQYQMQNLASQYIDGYSGFNDDAFNDGDDTLQTIDHRTEMNFDLSEGELAHQQEMFKQVCAQNINTLDDADDQIFEEREHTFQTVIEKQDRHEAAYSSDSDDDSPVGEDTMDIDPWSSPRPAEAASAAAVLAVDPWSSAAATCDDDTVGGWADFGGAPFDAGFASFAGVAGERDGEKGGDEAREAGVAESGEVEKAKANSIDRPLTSDVKPIIVETKMKSAAGDQADGAAVGADQKTATTGVTEPSKSVEGDCNVQTGSVVKGNAENEKV
ncbi:unnamed protein product [Phaedon cochleariae]|uniref:Serine/threonine-protein phosphatase 6 regulatory subunit 3 n=1 Tax=Phaedon cochleariae TaxID=80249 RepID=A0A9P0DBQ4_PHACE|nr:unnamed protein product [Phaedon cochleariae]